MPYVNIRITKEKNVTPEKKRQLIEGTTNLLRDILGKHPKSVHVTIDEVETDNWGVGGVSVTELLERQQSKRPVQETTED